MPAISPDSESSQSSSGYEDGIGRRVLAFDRETGDMLERLVLRPELSAFEPALKERMAIVAGLEDERFTRPRTIERDGDDRLTVISEFVAGRRLSDVLDAAAEHGIIAGLDAGLGLLLELLPALARIHDAGLAHGAVAPGRILVTPAGQLVLLDSIYADPLERLKLTRRRLWSEFRLAFPSTAGVVRFDKPADLGHAAMVTAALTVGRPLRDDDYPDGIPALRQEILEIASIRGSKGFAEAVDKFFGGSLPLAGKRAAGTGSADEAAIDLRKLVRKELGINTCRTALVEFFQQVDAADAERIAAEGMQQDQTRADTGRLEVAAGVETGRDTTREARERTERDSVNEARERAEAARAEAERRDAERAAQERVERERAEAVRIERERAEAARAEAQRAERDRIERERAEADRAEKARVEGERLERERVAAEHARLEAERLERERHEAERAEQARLEAERLERERAEKARLDAERIERERVEAERAEKARLEAERVERERVAAKQARLEAERLERERQEAERAEKARLEAERVERERVAAEQARLEAERLERERQEAERAEKARLEAERLERERVAAEKARLEAERIERERLEAERLERERLEAERLEKARLEAERIERERVAAEKARLEAERLERERLEAARLEKARLEAERIERERLEAERAEKARLEAERIERERLEAERAEKARLEAERLEQERAEKARLDAERIERERAEKARCEAERLERERLENERRERVARERADKARLEAERAEKARLEAERLDAERADAERRERELLEAARAERERAEKARAEADRLERERVEQARLEAERDEQEEIEERNARARAEAQRLDADRAEADRLAALADVDRIAADRAEAERLAADRAEAHRATTEQVNADQRGRDRERERERQRVEESAPGAGGWLIPPDRASKFEPAVEDAPARTPAARSYPIYVPPAEPAAWTADMPVPDAMPEVEPVAAAAPAHFGVVTPPSASGGIRFKDEASNPFASPARSENRSEPSEMSAAGAYEPFQGGKEPQTIPWKLLAAGVVLIAATMAIMRGYSPSSAMPIIETVRKAAPKAAPVAAAAPPPVAGNVGRLMITTQPAGARVTIDGKAAGETPLTVDAVKPGRHVVVITAAGGASARRTLRVESGQTVTLDVPLFSGFAAISAPFVLDVSENGKALGTSEDQILLSPGSHKLRVSNKDLDYVGSETVEIQPGEVTRLSLDPRGRANINAAPWAEVWIDGEKAGETPMANVAIRLGIREIIFKNPQFGERKVTTTIKANAPATISIDFSK